MNRRRTTRALVGAVSLLLLAGCGHHPGAAIQVGDTTVDRSQVDAVANAECRLLKGTQATVIKSQAVASVVNQMLTSTAQLAYRDAHGTSYDAAAFRANVASFDQEVAQLPVKLPADQAKTLRDAFVDTIKGDQIAVAVGSAELGEKSVTADNVKAVRAAGNKVVLAWARKQGVKVDPRYNIGDSQVAGAGDGSISKPTTSFAKSAASGSSDQSFVGSLPAAQLCG